MARKLLSYKETLRIVENFMIKSGIREYCSEVCIGSCCGSCYTSAKACHKNEGRRISCSIYFCGRPSIMPRENIATELIHPFRQAERHIVDQVSEAWKAVGKGKKSDWGNYVPTPNSYFTVHTKEMMKAYKADRKIVMKGLNAKAAKKIRFYVDMIIKAATVALPKDSKKDRDWWGKRITRFRVEHSPENGYVVKDSAGRIFNI